MPKSSFEMYDISKSTLSRLYTEQSTETTMNAKPHFVIASLITVLILAQFLSLVRQHSTTVLFWMDDDLEEPGSWTVTSTSTERNTITATTIISGNGQCQCELLSTECLDSIACIPSSMEQQSLSVVRGILTREIIRELSDFVEYSVESGDDAEPIGKGLQYATTKVWNIWTDRRPLPDTRDGPSIFVDASLYPYCVKRNITGKNCFFRYTSSSDKLDRFEKVALSNFPLSEPEEVSIKKGLLHYRNNSRTAGQALPALSHLLVFAHISRILFNPRPTIIQSYQRYLTTISGENDSSDSRPLRVSLHVRRADSCEHEKEGGKLGLYRDKPSKLNSAAQTSGKRFCYTTSVYMDALNRIKNLTSGRSLEIYLSTDYAGTLLEEIRTQFPDLYHGSTWKYLNFPRSVFAYEDMIDNDEFGKRAFLGETAVDDLWLLSHGQVFVGHMGSRFGKVGWLLATAKYNAFVPFFTVDGHSFCCEIDEVCGEASSYIKSMEHCMTFAHDLAHSIETNGTEYWEIGSTKRRKYVTLQKKRHQRFKEKMESLHFSSTSEEDYVEMQQKWYQQLKYQMSRIESWLGD